MIKNTITIISLFTIFLLPCTSNASEVTGTLTTGVESGAGSMDGIVIGPPTASPVAGSYNANQTITLNSSGSTAICYTTDDTTPSCATSLTCTNGSVYSTAITVSSTDTIKSISCYGNGSYSAVASDTYTLTCSTSTVTNGTVSAYPTCAVTCNSGYTLSGSTCVGAGSGVVTSSGGGGGGGGGGYVAPADSDIEKTQTLSTTSDGVAMSSETTITNSYNAISEIKVEAVITPVSSSTVPQIIKLDTSKLTLAKDVTLTISPTLLNDLVFIYGVDKEIKVTISAKDATTEQKSESARGGKFLVGYDVFSITIEVNNEIITDFSDFLSISFDVTGIESKELLKAYYYDTIDKKWKLAGEGGAVVNNRLTLGINHLTDYALIRDIIEVVETPAPTVLAETLDARQEQWQQVENDASIAYKSGSDLASLLSHNNVGMDVDAQTNGMEKYIPNLIEGINNLTKENKYAVNNFIVYGTISTRILGAGERAGVVNSYKKAFGKLPITQSEWEDCIAIGNGRWPGEKSETAEDNAKIEFKKVYLRDANMSNPNDNAAVTVMAYGLRPSSRNLNSETVAIKTFKHIYKYNPSSALDWDVVRAIAYSGATR